MIVELSTSQIAYIKQAIRYGLRNHEQWWDTQEPRYNDMRRQRLAEEQAAAQEVLDALKGVNKNE